MAGNRLGIRIGGWLVEPDLLCLSRGELVRHVEPKAMALLILLAERAPEVVSRAEILGKVWEGRAVVDAVLTRAVSLLRQALDDDAREPRFIETIATKGYRMVAEVSRVEPAAPVDRQQRIQLRRAVLASLAVLAVTALAVGLLRPSKTPEPAMAATANIRSLVVLPFVDLSNDPDDAYFAAGLTEALVTRLTRLNELRVISPASAEAHSNSGRPMARIADDLSVQAILQGSVVRTKERVRVSARLVDARDGVHLWAQEYDREMSDILFLHAAIAQAVASAVRLQLTPREVSALGQSAVVDSAAYRLYLQGRFHWNRRTIPDLEQSLELFQQAVALDPSYAPAQAGIADAYLLLSTYYRLPPTEAFPQALAAAERALALDPDLPEAYASLGAVHMSLGWNFTAARDAYRRALELGPGYATAHQWYAELLSVMGQHDAAVSEGRRAWELDPLAPIISAALGQRLSAAGRWEQALEQFGHTLELEPRFAWIHREMAYAETHLGRNDRALIERLREMAARGIDERQLAELRAAIDADGMGGFWRWELARLQRQAEDRFVPALLFAEAWEGSGDRDRALQQLERALAERGDHILQLTTSPRLMDLARAPRAQRLLSAAGLGHLGRVAESRPLAAA